MSVTILDGALGTELTKRGVDTSLPLWSACALITAPEVVAQIHREYAEAGATVHTTNTFRTKRRTMPTDWEMRARQAVALARQAVPREHHVAGSISPLEDCYRPDLSPNNPRPEHRELARVLADAGCDILLCETFPNVSEALIAVEEAVATGVETWVAFTAGPDANLLTPAQVSEGAREAIRCGARAVLINCTPVSETLAFVEALAKEAERFGAYANAGLPTTSGGWEQGIERNDPETYARYARAWASAGATIIGSCCGTGIEHTRALARWSATQP